MSGKCPRESSVGNIFAFFASFFQSTRSNQSIGIGGKERREKSVSCKPCCLSFLHIKYNLLALAPIEKYNQENTSILQVILPRLTTKVSWSEKISKVFNFQILHVRKVRRCIKFMIVSFNPTVCILKRIFSPSFVYITQLILLSLLHPPFRIQLTKKL